METDTVSPVTVDIVSTRTAYVNTGAGIQIVYNLPASSLGLEYVFCTQNANGIQVVANGSDTILFSTAITSAGGNISSTTPGSTTTLLAIAAGQWIATSITGTWAPPA